MSRPNGPAERPSWGATWGLALRWAAVGLPTSFLLLAVALEAIYWLAGPDLIQPRRSELADSLTLWCLEAVGSIVVWCLAARWWPSIDISWWRIIAVFPGVVAAIGALYVFAGGDSLVPGFQGWPVFGLSLIGLLGFAWTLVAARALLPSARPGAALLGSHQGDKV